MRATKRIAARIKVLEITASWLEDQTCEASSDTLVGEDGDYNQDLVSEANNLSQKLYRQAAKLKQPTEK